MNKDYDIKVIRSIEFTVDIHDNIVYKYTENNHNHFNGNYDYYIRISLLNMNNYLHILKFIENNKNELKLDRYFMLTQNGRKFIIDTYKNELYVNDKYQVV